MRERGPRVIKTPSCGNKTRGARERRRVARGRAPTHDPHTHPGHRPSHVLPSRPPLTCTTHPRGHNRSLPICPSTLARSVARVGRDAERSSACPISQATALCSATESFWHVNDVHVRADHVVTSYSAEVSLFARAAASCRTKCSTTQATLRRAINMTWQSHIFPFILHNRATRRRECGKASSTSNERDETSTSRLLIDKLPQ